MGWMQQLFGPTRASRNRKMMDALHGQLVQATRQDVFYTQYGVADTFDGRFETLLLMASLVLMRLNALPAPAPEAGQELVDTMMRHFDITLRQEGVGDVTVPKRLKKYAQALAGRYSAYAAAIESNDEAKLQESLARNLGEGVNVVRLSHYVFAAHSAFATCDLAVFTDGHVPFPQAAEVE